ncbi:MAG: hypothetical protein M0C28_40030 [Candidatus Moduliflexus flocculans]|nr:hypothetical protein [Candidatus Moduliflexus flocculans]
MSWPSCRRPAGRLEGRRGQGPRRPRRLRGRPALEGRADLGQATLHSKLGRTPAGCVPTVPLKVTVRGRSVTVRRAGAGASFEFKTEPGAAY